MDRDVLEADQMGAVVALEDLADDQMGAELVNPVAGQMGVVLMSLVDD